MVLLLTRQDVADLEHASQITIHNTTGLQDAANLWVHHRTDKADRDQYTRHALAQIKILDRSLKRISDRSESAADARLASDLATPQEGRQVSAADQIRDAKAQIEFLVARENGEQAWFDRTVKLLLLTLLLVEYYRLGGKDTLPPNNIEVADDTNNAQFRFVSAFISILDRHLARRADLPGEHIRDRRIIVDDLKRSKAGTLVDLLREAKTIALNVIAKMPFGYELRGTKIVALEFDPLIDIDFSSLDPE